MVFLVYSIRDKKVYFDGVYQIIKDAEDKQQLLNDPVNDVQYDIVDLPYWTPQERVVMRYSEEDNDIEEEDYYKLLHNNKKLYNTIYKQQELINYMDNYISYLNYVVVGFISIIMISLCHKYSLI
jgi:hypothetical protein